jgi:hypothetical protein
VRVLLDENLDHALRKLLGTHDVVTAAYMGWAGLKNGELLRAAEENGIDVLLTGDQTLSLEQNLSGIRIAVVALSAVQLPIIKNSLPAIVATIDRAKPGSFQKVECATSAGKGLGKTERYADIPGGWSKFCGGRFRDDCTPGCWERGPHWSHIAEPL